MATFGGVMSFRLSNGTQMRIRGDFTERPSNITAATVTNQDGSIDKTITPRPYGFSATFVDEGQDFDDLLLETGINATVVEENTGKTRLYSGGQFSGEVSIDRSNGAVTGLEFDAPNRQVV
ncbi:conserved hypothetical protein [uncultured Pleomorphomonas sp.]|uniref:Phage tail protein n=1 Tax=uncultured Pleomorphomonas sp. TaxID=442121 RepID=A0A212L727_9HYPH|nr:phage tail tube protein [uncultured Pleomorphomonas sp.]SCM73373.1 conserved hypothetical protein [uncultured Pleomorphomonas sp.]